MGNSLKRRVETAVAAAAALLIAGLGFFHQGVPAAEVELHDGGVWIVNQSRLMVGHLNYEAKTQDSGLRVEAANTDLLQSGNNVLVTGGDTVQPLDPASVSLVGQGLVNDLQLAHGADTALIADSKEGNVWALDSLGAGSFNQAAEPGLSEVTRPKVAVGVTGTGYVLTADGVVYTVQGTGESAVFAEAGFRLPDEVSEQASLTVSGEHLVVLDKDRLYIDAASYQDDSFAGAVLQQPSAPGDHVLLATSDELLKVAVSSGEISRIAALPGEAAAPVWLDGCSYGLWKKAGYFLRDCGSEELNIARQLPELAEAKNPVFRTNRHVIVINDVVTGAAFVADESLERIDDWDLIATQLEQQEQQESDDSEDIELSQIQEQSDEQHPPEARDDEFGARLGSSVTLPVLLNDLDIDGDVLTVQLEDTPATVPVSLSRDGRAVTIQLPNNQTSPVTFSYRAFDGVDVSAPATVKVNPRTSDQNDPPRQARPSMVYLSERASIEYAALADWVDPDGDPIYLEKVVGAEGISANWRADGFTSIKDLGTAGPGKHSASLVVSDGRASQAGEMTMQVSPGSSNSAPVANNDHFVATTKQALSLTPLANDTDPDQDELLLVDQSAVPEGVELVPDYDKGTFEFRSERSGNFTFDYTISDGPHSAKGKIRVDVLDPKDAAETPVAQNDLALLSPNQSVLIDPLLNDHDPAGGVLVLESHSASSDQGITVEMLEHAKFRISSLTALDQPVSFNYAVSNGKATAQATVLVVPAPPATDIVAPVAMPDEAVVRAGDIVGLEVLDNDFSPSGLELKLLPEITTRGADGVGEFFVHGDKVRFRAGAKPGTAYATYTAMDSEGNVAASDVTVVVKEFESGNQKPVPKPIEGRTFAGTALNIQIPFDGVDPDGDTVTLVGGGEKQPDLGSITVEGNTLRYEPNLRSSGTDTFDYVVRDRFGVEGSSTIRVGIIPPPATNIAPVAITDEVAARPNTRIEIPVLSNDLDPDGDRTQLKMVADSVKPVDAQRWAPETEQRGGFVSVVTPQEEGIYQLYYSITDGGGAPVVGVISIEVGEDVPPVAPVVNDDYVSDNEVAGRDFVEVNLLDNDFDLDGDRRELEVSVEEPASYENGMARIPLTDDRQVLLYRVTDRDQLSATAAIVVPGVDQLPPQLDPAKIPAKVKGGETLTISLDEYVLTRADHRAMLTSSAQVAAGPGGDTTDTETAGLKVLDEHTISFTPDKLFIGATSVSFEVTDGANLEDPRGLRSKLSLPIEVLSSGLFPPELRPSEVQVAPGESPVAAQLSAMVNDPDPGDNEKMAYSIVSAEDPLSASISGQTMNVSVPATAVVGQTHQVVVRVHDGSTDPLEMTVPVRVIRSPRPLMQITELHEKEGRSGKPFTFNLASAITNPFAAEGGAIKIVGTPQVQGSATVSVDGLNLTVTPNYTLGDSGGVDTVAVSYTAQDATEDPTRQRTGVVRLTVKDVPKAPTNVTAATLGSRSAKVTWSHSGWRGGTQQGFVVSWPGGSKDCGLTSSCDITTLTNNKDYQFTVRAVVKESDIADSPESPVSNSVFVDAVPNTPGAPRVTADDEQVNLSWDRVSVPDGGSPVEDYTVYISPAAPSGQTQRKLGSANTELKWTGLRNGTPYRFRIEAHNRGTERNIGVVVGLSPSRGPESERVIPAGAPKDQGAPKVQKDRAQGQAPLTANLSWAPPGNPNGDSSFRYQVRENGGNQVCDTSEARCTISLTRSTEDRTYQVRSTNKSGKWSDWSPASNAIRAFTPPGAPPSFVLEATGRPNEVRFSFGAAEGNGARPGEIRYEWRAGGHSGQVKPGQVINSPAFPVGRNVSVSLRAISTVNGDTAQGADAVATVSTWGPPEAPRVSAQSVDNGAKVELGWQMPATSNGRNISLIWVNIDGNNQSKSGSGSTKVGDGPNQNHCISGQLQNDKGVKGASSGNPCASTKGKGSAVGYHGADVISCKWAGEKCHKMMLRLTGWYPYANVECTLYAAGEGNRNVVHVAQVDGAGNWQGQWGNGVIGINFQVNEQDVTNDCRYR